MCDQQGLRSACAYAQSDQSLCQSLEYFMNIKLLTEHQLEFLSLKMDCRGLSESTPVKMPRFWKSYVAAHIVFSSLKIDFAILAKSAVADDMPRSAPFHLGLHSLQKQQFSDFQST